MTKRMKTNDPRPSQLPSHQNSLAEDDQTECRASARKPSVKAKAPKRAREREQLTRHNEKHLSHMTQFIKQTDAISGNGKLSPTHCKLIIKKLDFKPSDEPTAEEKCWRAVLIQAVRDCRGIKGGDALRSWRFLTIKNDWLEQVCEFAGLTADYVQRVIYRVVFEGVAGE